MISIGIPTSHFSPRGTSIIRKKPFQWPQKVTGSTVQCHYRNCTLITRAFPCFLVSENPMRDALYRMVSFNLEAGDDYSIRYNYYPFLFSKIHTHIFVSFLGSSQCGLISSKVNCWCPCGMKDEN